MGLQDEADTHIDEPMPTWWRWERGDYRPRIRLAQSLSTFLNVPIEFADDWTRQRFEENVDRK